MRAIIPDVKTRPRIAPMSCEPCRTKPFKCLAKKNSAKWVLEADIKSCFDQISHNWMVANIPTDKAILKKWLEAGFIYKNELFPTDARAPQRGIHLPGARHSEQEWRAGKLWEEIPPAKTR